MKFKTKALLLSSMILFVALSSAYRPSFSEQTGLNTFSQPETQSPESGRTIDFKWYSFFDVPIKTDVWDRRWDRAGKDLLLSSTYPVVYLWQPAAGWNYYYTSARLKVTARELPEISIDSPKFLPYNLMAGLELGVVGGTAQIKDWYLDYLDDARREALGFPFGSWDGYNTELRGAVVMDKSATKKILGITEAQYQSLKVNPASWWATNEKSVETAWSTWLHNEDARLNIFPFFEYPFTDWLPPPKYTEYLTLSYDLGLDQVTLTIDIITWGMECLLARWFQESFMPGYEWWWDDFRFNATIGPSLTNLDLDTAVTWAMYMWSYFDTAFADPVWVFEAVRGDIPDVAYDKGVTTSPAYPYHNKTYYVVAPGNEWYNKYGDYDYTPSAWNLKQGETLSYDWSNVYQKGPLWVFKQAQWGIGQMPNDTITRVYGMPKLSTESSEPYADWETFPSQVSYDLATRTITFTGPINMTDLSIKNIPSEWLRLKDPQRPNGLLPWGEPFIEFKVVEHDIAVSSVTPSAIEAPIGQVIDITVDVVNLGTASETFDVTAFYDSTPIGTQTVTSLTTGQKTTLIFSWNTAGLSKGDYVIKATAGPLIGEDQLYSGHNIDDNTLIGDTVRLGALHDVAVTSVVPSSPSVVVGDSVSIDAVVKNEGLSTETFNVTAFYDSTQIGKQLVSSLAAGENKSLTFSWNTIGVAIGPYTIKATADTVLGETYTADNTYIDGTVRVKPQSTHDIVVASVAASPMSVFIGENVTITAVIRNDGTSAESFNVTAFYDSNSIETKLVTDLQPDLNVTLNFSWNTVGVSAGDYTIKVTADLSTDEYPTDNTYVDGTVKVQAIIHDVKVKSVEASPTTVNVGDEVSIAVTVENVGMTTETFDVTLYYDNTIIGTTTVDSLSPGNTYPASFAWNTTGVAPGDYTIKGVATLLGDANLTDNTLTMVGKVSVRVPPVHDLKVINVSVSPAIVNVGDNVTVTVIVKNIGTVEETTSVAVYGNQSILATKPEVILTAGEERTLTFIWNTIGVDEGNYIIKATATSVPGETSTADNTFTDGTVTLTQAGPPPGLFGLPTELVIGIVVAVIIVVIIIIAAYMLRKKKSTTPTPSSTTK